MDKARALYGPLDGEIVELPLGRTVYRALDSERGTVHLYERDEAGDLVYVEETPEVEYLRARVSELERQEA